MTVVRVLLPLILTGIMVFSIIDIITIDSSRVRHLPKGFWVILVIILSFIGSILWFGIGRESLQSAQLSRHPEPRDRPAKRVAGPDDDPEFLWRVQRDREQEERIKRLEARLAELDDDSKPE